MSEEQVQEHTHRSPKWHKRLIIALMVIVGVSVAARVVTKKDKPAARPATSNSRVDSEGNPLMPSSLTGDDVTPDTEPVADKPSTTEKVLPFVTEGGIAMIIGTMLGMATRMVAKVVIFLVAVFFVGLQFMSYKGWIGDINWSGMATWTKDFVLNISSDDGIGGIVKHKLPSAGSLGLGYYLGLKKGD